MHSFLQRIKDHIHTKDDTVFRVLMYSISNYPYVPDDITAELLKYSRQSQERRMAVLSNIEKAAFGEASIGEWIKCLKDADTKERKNYLNLVSNVELEKLFEHRSELEPFIPEKDWTSYEKIRNVSEEEELYMIYADLLQDLSAEYSSRVHDFAKRAMDELIKREWLTEEEAIGAVEESMSAPYLDYNGLLNIYALRYFPDDRYVSTLAKLLTVDEDLIVDETGNTLNYFQSDAVVDELYPLCKGDDSVYPIGLLSETKTDYALAALRNLYEESADDLELRELIVEGMCLHFSEEAIQEVEAFMEEGVFSGMVDMDETAYAYFKVINREHPDLMLWKSEAEDREEQFFDMMSQPPLRKPFEKVEKAGQNDPCPCGSGKKYKKCCGA
ncbi:hypothetical protein GCM10010954_17520 [Halobacillus andaensis]|uniref:SEC-C motif-containing protein n=1 Tax=Halobacillus andaensis TaxID=1176239 RepID=A0A917EVS6_HALAA|nr:SEC-C metal-binding domain-containing protein [Halobacillus andaensis]MBP2004745.1 hypothetical protein [Halobacillus andaensis]GGF19288.1 hypothetical protein GCM10010954_17520 [Halobacillus andaensis]